MVSRDQGIPASATARSGAYRQCESLATEPPFPADPFTSSARALRCASTRARAASRARARVRSTHSSHESSVGAHATLNCPHRITAAIAPYPHDATKGCTTSCGSPRPGTASCVRLTTQPNDYKTQAPLPVAACKHRRSGIPARASLKSPADTRPKEAMAGSTSTAAG